MKNMKIFERICDRFGRHTVLYALVVAALLTGLVWCSMSAHVYAGNVSSGTDETESAAQAEEKSEEDELPEGKYTTIEDLTGKKMGVRPSSPQEQYVRENIKDPVIEYYDSFADMAVALTQGKLDGFSTTSIIASGILEKYSGLTLLGEVLTYSPIYFALGKSEEGLQLKAELDAYIEEIDSNGELAEIKQRWYDGDYSGYDLGYEALPDVKGTLTLATSCAAEPYSFNYNNSITGIDIEIITRFCKASGYALKIEVIETSGMLAGLETGKYQIAACSLSKTAEREEHVNFSIAYEECPIVVIVQTAENSSGSQGGGLMERIRTNLLEEDRWKMILSGMWVTILLSMAAVFFGTLLGFLLCLGECSHYMVLKKGTQFFLRFIQGIPTVLLLMFLYYVVFTKIVLSSVTVAAIGFILYFAVYAADIFYSGIQAVDIGQTEACKVLGLGKTKGFIKVILPQAINYTLPVYRNQVVSIIKATSVAGYIAVQDITKVSDIIRSRTFDAFIPLLISAAVYFAIAYLARTIISLIGRPFDPAKRKPDLRGVRTDHLVEKTAEEKTKYSDNDCVLTVEHLHKRYENAEPIRDLSLEVTRGESICIIGPSGTGKSTLLRCICGLEQSDSGAVRVQDGSGIGMVFQAFHLFPHLTLIENMMLAPVAVRHISRQEAYDEGMRLLSKVGLADKALNYPASLSGGQKQRAAIARALAMQPNILLFDEPTSALDPTMVGEIIDILRQLSLDGITILIVTHEMKVAKEAAERVIFLNGGGICEEGSPEQIFNHPQKAQTKAFLQEQQQMSLQITLKEMKRERLTHWLETFIHQHFLSYRTSYHMQLCVEELLENGFRPAGVESVHLTICLESENSMALTFRYSGTENAWENMDDISRKMVEGVCLSHEFRTRKKEKQNESTLVLKIQV